MYKAVGIFLICFGLFFSATPLFGDQAGAEPSGASKDLWQISADEMEYDHKTGEYAAKGNVKITRSNRTLSADFVRLNQNSMTAIAKGHVMLTIGDDYLEGERIDVDLKNETGTLYRGTLFLYENHFYIHGNKIEKLGTDSYRIDEADISSCDGPEPDWQITGRNLEVTLDGYGVVRNARFLAGDLPIFYVPYLIFPVKLKRQTGLLPPQIGYASRKGFEYMQPFFWAISDSSDATAHAQYSGKRGIKSGLEYRYVLDSHSRGTLMFDFLKDRKIDDGTADATDNWGYAGDVGGTDISRPNQDRYWFRMKKDMPLPYGITTKIDLDIVSDQDYLHEFKDGYTGFDDTEKAFNRDYGRELDDYDDPVRVNRINFSRMGAGYGMNLEGRWYDDVIARRWQQTDTTVHKLPFFEFQAFKQKFFETPLFFKLDSEYVYFYRQSGTRGHREDLFPRIYLPLRYHNYVMFEPSVGMRSTFWQISHRDPSEQENDHRFDREIFDVKLDLSTEVYRIFNRGSDSGQAVRHSLRPGLTYEYIPHKDQSHYPFFDDVDRIDKTNQITWSLTNTLTRRIPLPSAPGKNTQQDDDYPASGYHYQQFCRFKLEQSYDINEAKETDSNQWKTPGQKQPFSPLYGELEIFSSWGSIQLDALWNLYSGDVESRNIAVGIHDQRGDSIYTEYRYSKDTSESIVLNTKIVLTDRVAVYADYERNLYDNTHIRSGTGLTYTRQCWSVDLRYGKEDDDFSFSFLINLNGLGGIGTN